MINVRNQIREALLEITENVRMTRPEGEQVFPLITMAEITNVNVNMREDRIEYQIDAYHNTFEDVIDLMQKIDNTMTELGWHRTYVTPDSQTRRGTDFYQKSMNYVARIDTYFMDITGGY